MGRHPSKKRKRSSGNYMASAGRTALKALRVANEVKSLLNVEFKMYQLSVGGLTGGSLVDWDGYSVVINNIGQGDEVGQRDGDQVRMKRS